MAESDRRPSDGWDANDLPLNSIPSAREARRPTPRPEREPSRDADGGVGKYVVAIALLFGLIVSVSFVAAPYVRVPGGAAADPAPAVDTVTAEAGLRVEAIPEQVAAPPPPVLPSAAPMAQPTVAPRVNALPLVKAAEPAGTVAAETVAATAAKPPVEPVREPPDPTLERRITELEGELEKRTRSLAEARAAHDEARKGIRDAEREHEKTLRAVEAELNKKHEARLTELQSQLTQAVTARDDVSARSGKQIAELEGRLAAADQRVNSAEGTLQQKKSAHEAQLAGEGKAVRSLLGDLTRARDELAAEKKARAAAEARARELEGEQVARRSPASSSPAAAPAVVPASTVAPRPTETTPPERVTTVPPRYPDELRQTRVTGRVVLRMLIDELGNVSEVKLESSPHQQLTTAATRAAWLWKYNPARRNGLRVKMWINEAVDFQL